MLHVRAFPPLALALLASLSACERQQAPEAESEPGQEASVTATPGAAVEGTEQPATEAEAETPQVIVSSSLEDLINYLKQEDWWGEPKAGEPLQVPHLLIAAINPSWQDASRSMPVQQKKALFYRLMLPLVMHANSMVGQFRDGLETAKTEIAESGQVSPESLALLQRLALLLPGETQEYVDAMAQNSPELGTMIDSLLYRIDFVPPGLALGQAAYESGYGTSRFAVEGNSFFGQWTYKDDGIKPREQRKSRGNHQIKAFDWPFDSVRGYFINLMSHPAYEDFRHLRAQLRAEGKPLDSLALADGLLSYSERGQEYVDSLKGMIRHNHLNAADDAVLRDEPVRFLINEPGEAAADQMRADIKKMRTSGELQDIVANMRLE